MSTDRKEERHDDIAHTTPYSLSVVVPKANGGESKWSGVYKLEGPRDVEFIADVLDGSGASLSAYEVSKGPVTPARFAEEKRVPFDGSGASISETRAVSRWALPDVLKGRLQSGNAMPAASTDASSAQALAPQAE